MLTLLLFDVDGTLTQPRDRIDDTMVNLLNKLKSQYTLAVVGGSNFEQLEKQLPLYLFDYVFAENGLDALINNTRISNSCVEVIGKDRINELNKLVTETLLSWGFVYQQFIDIRRGLLNISPIGFHKTVNERNAFYLQDQVYHYRKRLITILKTQFPDLDFVIGGVVSFDVFPKGWDKTYCLKFLSEFKDRIHFFGDKMYCDEDGSYGNDFLLSINDNIHPHPVKSWQETFEVLSNVFDNKDMV